LFPRNAACSLERPFQLEPPVKQVLPISRGSLAADRRLVFHRRFCPLG
jgi:hypothetical protein